MLSTRSRAARRPLTFLALLCATLLALGDGQALAAPAPAASLAVSTQADRSSAQPLAGRTYAQPARIYVFVTPATGVKRVRFYLDDTTMSASPRTVVSAPPLDFAGTASDGSANPLATDTLSPQSHTITAAVEMTSGKTRVVSATFTLTAAAAPAALSVTVDRSAPITTSRLELGVTTTQYSLDAWGDPSAIADGQRLLDSAVTYQNQFIYGWGATNPNPSPGVYDWTRLDARMAMARGRANAIPVFTLCGAPDWMTTQATNTSNYQLQLAPTPAHYDDFAELARQIALRYSAPTLAQPVLYYQAWSELRGFWSSSLNNMDYVAFTTLYNKVYDALKSVNPAIQVGGPYAVIEGNGATQDLGVPSQWYTASPLTARQTTFLNYWFANKHGADFITLDKAIQDYQDPTAYTTAQKFKLVHWYGDAIRRVRALPGYKGEPIWWSEGFAFSDNSDLTVQRAAEAASLRAMLLADTDVMLKWQDQGTYWAVNNTVKVTGLYSDTRYAGGGQPYPSYTAYKLFHDDFPAGTPIYRTTVSSSQIEAIASPTRILLINETAASVTVNAGGTVVTLSAYEVRDVPA